MRLDALVGFDHALTEIPNVAATAERSGAAGLWTAETRHDPFLPAALAIEHTSRMEVGTAVAVAFARSPTVVAHVAWDLARQSNGRFILGLGTQVRAHVERRFSSAWSGRPVAQLRDYVSTIRQVWHSWQSGAPLRHRSDHYNVTLMTPFFDPGPIDHPMVPIYLAGVGESMCALAGEIGDGLIVHPLHSPRYLREVVLPAVADGAARAGRDPTAVTIAGSVLVGIGDDGRERMREEIAFYASTPTYRRVLELHGWDEIGARLSALARRGRWEQLPFAVPDEMLDAFGVVSSWDGLGQLLQDRYAGLLDRVALYHAFDPTDEERWRGVAARMSESR